MYSMYQQLRAPWGRHGSSGWTGTRPEVGRRVRVRTPPAHTPPDTGYADHRTASRALHRTAAGPERSEHTQSYEQIDNERTQHNNKLPTRKLSKGSTPRLHGGQEELNLIERPRQARSLLPRVHPAT